jgi:NAD(P)-dependent dehydrogenase (short-subunit alcohol dehydrogenase family)
MDLELAGKTVLITGGSKGIGLAVGKGFAAEGCDLHLTARTEEDLRAAKGIIEQAHGVKVQIHPLDLASPGAAENLRQAAGEVDILINNAGAIPGGDVLSIDESRWREAWDLKVFGYINMTRLYLDLMTARGDGVIVNITGTAGENPDSNYVAGCAGNASLMAFSKAVGGTSIDRGVRVLAVNPGPVETDRITALLKTWAEAEFGDRERWRELTKKWPQGRAAKAEECADLVVFAASARASYISGVVLTIDGGLGARA